MEKRVSVGVFRKLYILCGILILVVLVSTGAVFIQYAGELREQEMDSMRELVRYHAEDLKQQLDSVFIQECNLVLDARLNTLADRETRARKYDRMQLAREIVPTLDNICYVTKSVDNLSIDFPQTGLYVDSSRVFQYSRYKRKERGNSTSARTLIVNGEEVLMELLYPLTFACEEGYIPDFSVCASFSKEYFNNLTEYFSNGEDGGAFLVLDSWEDRSLSEENELSSELKAEWLACTSDRKKENWLEEKIQYNGSRYIVMSQYLEEYGITLAAYCNGAVTDNAMFSSLLVMLIVLLVISILFILLLKQTNRSVERPIRKLMEAFEKVQNGNMNVSISHDSQDEFQFLYNSFNHTTERIRELLHDVAEQGKLLQNAELIQLQSQINPHFLYNSFHLIRIMAKNESYDQIMEFVTSLAKYYRFLNKEVDQTIELEKEAEHMNTYIQIQQMRFGDKITVETEDLPEGVRSYRVPKLILQPLVENAYNYGMKDTIRDGRIRIQYRMDEEEQMLWIIVEDNGKGGTEENLEQMRLNMQDYKGHAAGHALSNISRRLKLAYGNDSGMMLEISELGGVKVILQLDLTRHLL